MEYFYRSRLFDEEGKPIRAYRKRIFREWRKRGLFRINRAMCMRPGKINYNEWVTNKT